MGQEQAGALAASLLFARNSRPDRAAIFARSAQEGGFAVFERGECPDARPASAADGDSIAAGAAGPHSPDGSLILHIGDFAFVLSGLAGGAPAPLPPDGDMAMAGNTPHDGLEAITIEPAAGPAGYPPTIPMIRCLALLVAQLASLPGLRAVAWRPAGGWASPQHFRASVLRWAEGGVFPGLALASLRQMEDGGLRSRGVALFTGQELQLHPDLAREAGNGARVALQLMHWLVGRGPLTAQEQLAGPSGERLLLLPSPDGRAVIVRMG